MNIQLVPDLVEMAMLLAILYFLRRRHPQEDVELWIVGLLFIFVEAVAHAFYVRTGVQRIIAHVVALDAYLAAVVIFLWAGSKRITARRQTLIYLAVSAVPLAAVETVYALDVKRPGPYHLIAGAGGVLGLATPFVLARGLRLGRGWWLQLLQLTIWASVWIFTSASMYRDAAYFPLFVLYLAAAVLFAMSLPRESLGRVAIVLGFAVWSLVFGLHSWVAAHPQYTQLASDIWDWQKFMVAIGMILVLLERQVASNEWFAFHDQLTGLPNRRLFEERLEQALRSARETGRRSAVVMLDLNGFKSINDSMGHDVGDALLREIAQQLRHVIRVPDTLARLGGDEFIIVTADLPVDLSVEEIVSLNRNRIVQALQRTFQVGGQDVTVSASVGVAVYPDDGVEETELRRLADHRMYQQKQRAMSLTASEA